MKPTPEAFLLGAVYLSPEPKRYRFVRSRPSGIPRIEIRSPEGALLGNPVVKTAAVAAYLENLP
jgi:hypothetical protein